MTPLRGRHVALDAGLNPFYGYTPHMLPNQPAVCDPHPQRADPLFADLAPPPLALYVHFPWCVKKCPYCDFNSHERRAKIDTQGYINALLRDLDHDIATHDLAANGQRALLSIFMGGGTPSLFGGDVIARLLEEISNRVAFDSAIEITLEANPGAVEHGDFAAYRAGGVNRLSLGAQSFNDAQLAQLGRIHCAKDIRTAIAAAIGAGFDNFNIDLMHGLPAQTPQQALQDLQAAVEFAPPHLSLYQLTIEPNTLFHRHPPRLPEHDCLMEIQQTLHDHAAAHGYQRYEISAHARAGKHCRHNFNYWQFGDYLGIGAGAHGKITSRGEIKRYWKHKHPKKYLATAGTQQGIGASRAIAGDDALFEFLLNGLRLTNGFDTNLVAARTGQNSSAMIALLRDAIDRKLVVRDGSTIRCSAHGLRFLDDVLEGLLPSEVVSF